MAEKKENKNEEKTVRMTIPRERRDQEDKVVWVNARRFLIKRGVEVDIPECVAEVLRHEAAMLLASYDYMEKATRKAANAM